MREHNVRGKRGQRVGGWGWGCRGGATQCLAGERCKCSCCCIHCAPSLFPRVHRQITRHGGIAAPRHAALRHAALPPAALSPGPSPVCFPAIPAPPAVPPAALSMPAPPTAPGPACAEAAPALLMRKSLPGTGTGGATSPVADSELRRPPLLSPPPPPPTKVLSHSWVAWSAFCRGRE